MAAPHYWVPDMEQPRRFLRLPQVLDLFPVSASTLWKLVKTGDFPAPVKLAPNVTGWDAAAVNAHLVRLGKAGGAA
jgi:predicted DNA-binding transcriptional regulator AlpA